MQQIFIICSLETICSRLNLSLFFVGKSGLFSEFPSFGISIKFFDNYYIKWRKSRNLSFIFGHFFRKLLWKFVRFALQNHATSHTIHSFMSPFVGIFPQICANYYIKRRKSRNLSQTSFIFRNFPWNLCKFSKFPLKSVRFTS